MKEAQEEEKNPDGREGERERVRHTHTHSVGRFVAMNIQSLGELQGRQHVPWEEEEQTDAAGGSFYSKGPWVGPLNEPCNRFAVPLLNGDCRANGGAPPRGKKKLQQGSSWDCTMQLQSSSAVSSSTSPLLLLKKMTGFGQSTGLTICRCDTQTREGKS